MHSYTDILIQLIPIHHALVLFILSISLSLSYWAHAVILRRKWYFTRPTPCICKFPSPVASPLDASIVSAAGETILDFAPSTSWSTASIFPCKNKPAAFLESIPGQSALHCNAGHQATTQSLPCNRSLTFTSRSLPAVVHRATIPSASPRHLSTSLSACPVQDLVSKPVSRPERRPTTSYCTYVLQGLSSLHIPVHHPSLSLHPL